MDTKKIFKEIDSLGINEMNIILHYLVDKITNFQIPQKTRKKRQTIDFFDKYCGITKNIWQMDAQEYVKKNRDEERF